MLLILKYDGRDHKSVATIADRVHVKQAESPKAVRKGLVNETRFTTIKTSIKTSLI